MTLRCQPCATCGSTSDAAPQRMSATTLRQPVRDARLDDRLVQRGRVVLERPRRVDDLADLVEERAPELSSEVEALDLLLLPGRDVEPVLVEEADLERLRLVASTTAMWMPPTQRVFCVVNRLSAGEATRRSRTLMPAAFSPATIARFTMRAGFEVSRVTTTCPPLGSSEPYASATFRASSGVMSMPTSPWMPAVARTASARPSTPR